MPPTTAALAEEAPERVERSEWPEARYVPDHSERRADGVSVDVMGRVEFHRLNLPAFMGALPGLRQLFDRVVPAERFDGGPGRSVIAVNCVCGERCRIEPGLFARCSCDRWFVGAGSKVMGAYLPGQDYSPVDGR